ncbi:DUF4081 domain-containing GNAT family N-acetyltransferase [Oerskovia flava]|uniref:GNAT family N-acetyltransferase n=1 Tax=Oerskovia flava TaxID=2986422 RepID=UPI00223FE513|nr:DUF4081 domain-containing GNAT family N-acetyltransferase [Oerskovia sp. JB1-3-2]
MGRWRTAPPWTQRGAARVLSDADVPEALAVCRIDPVASVLAASRLSTAARTGLRRSGGQLWGFPEQGPLRAVCWAGANLVPVVPLTGTERAEAVRAFATLAMRFGRRCSSIVGEQEVTLSMWRRLAEHWSPAREVRADQPSLAISRDPDVTPDPQVRRSVLAELDIVLPACVRMFVEEVGYSPVEGGGAAYSERVRSLITTGRSFVRVEPVLGSPEVVFKAELGAVTPEVAQVQGVWVEPRFRGRRHAEAGMAAVVAQTRAQVAPVVSLYVNAYNAPALAAYRRVGFEQVGTFATVLF